MKSIAVITVCCNDLHKHQEWVENHRDIIAAGVKHIIVDNNSDVEYFNVVTSSFPNSIIIRLAQNCGLTGGYNSGIRLALKDSEVKSIMLLANDVFLNSESLAILESYLWSSTQLGMVSPVLISRDMITVEDYGSSLSRSLFMQPRLFGCSVSDIPAQPEIVEMVVGGVNLSKSSFYRIVGLQDERLFMYSDEVDMAIRGSKHNFKFAVTPKARAYHFHINPPGALRRLPYVPFLINRNKLILARKHFGFGKFLYVALSLILRNFHSLLKCTTLDDFVHIYFSFIGIYCGTFTVLNLNRKFLRIPE